MTLTKLVEFRKQRELGQIISDTFTFLRRNAKPLLSVLVRTCAIPFILLIVAVGFYTKATAGANFLTSFGDGSDMSTFFISVVCLAIVGIIYNSMLYGSVSEYIKAYIAGGNVPDTTAVVDTIKSKTGTFLGLGFTNLLIVLVVALVPVGLGGAIFATGSEAIGVLVVILAIFPLLYVYVKLSVIFPTLINKNLSIKETIKESSNLIKDEWWMTFITLIIIGFLIGVIGFVFQVPVVIYTLIKTITSVQSGSMGDPTALFDNVYLVLQVLASAMNYILYTILAISTNFIYFNLNERKNQTGSLDQINNIGSDNA
jgi:hypothetical protein